MFFFHGKCTVLNLVIIKGGGGAGGGKIKLKELSASHKEVRKTITKLGQADIN